MAVEHQPPDDTQALNSHEMYFLAGPIQGAPDWQREAVDVIKLIIPDQGAHIANPRRDYINGAFDYNAQVTWEDRNRIQAAKNGALIFWLAAQNLSLAYEEGRAYAQTTRFEFGEAIGWLSHDPHVRISLGIEPGYAGSERYYRHQADRFSITVFSTLFDTCIHGITRKDTVAYGDI